MEILLADQPTDDNHVVIAIFEAQEHTLRSCQEGLAAVDVPCSVLRGARCHLDTFPIDLALSVGAGKVEDEVVDEGTVRGPPARYRS